MPIIIKGIPYIRLEDLGRLRRLMKLRINWILLNHFSREILKMRRSFQKAEKMTLQ